MTERLRAGRADAPFCGFGAHCPLGSLATKKEDCLPAWGETGAGVAGRQMRSCPPVVTADRYAGAKGTVGIRRPLAGTAAAKRPSGAALSAWVARGGAGARGRARRERTCLNQTPILDPDAPVRIDTSWDETSMLGDAAVTR